MFVTEIDLTDHSTNYERPCTTKFIIMRAILIEYSRRLSVNELRATLVRFPVLSQIEPQAPRLVVSFRQFLQVSALQPYSPRHAKLMISRSEGALRCVITRDNQQRRSGFVSFTVPTTAVSNRLRT